jgi:hypothetical protein
MKTIPKAWIPFLDQAYMSTAIDCGSDLFILTVIEFFTALEDAGLAKIMRLHSTMTNSTEVIQLLTETEPSDG